MAKAKKLKSGSWRVLVFDDKVDGKRVYKSFTADSKKEAEFAAAEFALNKKRIAKGNLTVSEAFDKYIEIKTPVLSPSTIVGYKKIRHSNLQGIMDYRVSQLTNDILQKAISNEAKTHSPKTVRNISGLLTAVLSVYLPDFKVRITLPQKVKVERSIPNDKDIKRLIECAKGTPVYVPILLAAFCSLRRSEICGINIKEDLNDNCLHIQRAMVINSDNEWVLKPPKSFAGDRFVEVPQFVLDELKNWDNKDLTPNILSKQFTKVKKKANFNFRFHDLRHYYASICHALGMPDKYIMRSGGWTTSSVLKGTYQHTFDKQQKEFNNIVFSHFEKI